MDQNSQASSQALAALNQLVIAVNNLNQSLAKVLPVVQSTSTSATAGTNGALPAQVANYLNFTAPDGSSGRIPYFND